MFHPESTRAGARRGKAMSYSSPFVGPSGDSGSLPDVALSGTMNRVRVLELPQAFGRTRQGLQCELSSFLVSVARLTAVGSRGFAPPPLDGYALIALEDRGP